MIIKSSNDDDEGGVSAFDSVALVIESNIEVAILNEPCKIFLTSVKLGYLTFFKKG
jgi:hypothetical protein